METHDRLTDTERDALGVALENDGYVVLPRKLPSQLADDLLNAIDRITRETRGGNAQASVKTMNCVDADPAFRRLMRYEPALQLAYDVFGPMFHLCQSNFISRPRDNRSVADFVSSSPWHADGPRPGLFPKVNGAMGLHQAQWHAAPPNQSDVERKNVYISYCPTWMRPLDRKSPTEADLADLSSEERWLLGEPRPALRWWLPSKEDAARLARLQRDGAAANAEIRYD